MTISSQKHLIYLLKSWNYEVLLNYGNYQQTWPAILSRENDPQVWPPTLPTRGTPEFDLWVWPTSLTHELDPYENDPPNLVSSPPPFPSPAEAGGKWISQKTAAWGRRDWGNYFCSQRGRLHFRGSIFLRGDQRVFFNIFVFVILWSSVKDTKS